MTDATLPVIARARWQAWGIVGIVVILNTILWARFGPLHQDPAYHLFVDTRVWGGIPRAGDVLSNLSILLAALAGVVLWKRVALEPGERAVYALLVVGMLTTAMGSAYYHWAPDDARLVWDRLPMGLVLASVLTFILADRLDPWFAYEAWFPLAVLAIASVTWWSWSGDLRLYLMVRIGVGVAAVFLVVLRPGRHTRIGWLAAALALDIAMTLAERFDGVIFAVTSGIVSGHTVKHLLAGGVLGCVLAWLVRRKRCAVPGG